MPQHKIPAVYMRGGTSKGVFFRADVLPEDSRERDAMLLRITGSPDPYGKQIDGMGGATSSTSKVVLISRSSRPDCDVDYLFGAVSIEDAVIDWSGNCGNLTSAVGPFAIQQGLVAAPDNGVATVRIWQANINAKIIAHVPMLNGEVQEEGSFVLDGVAFPSAEIPLEFLDPGEEGEEAPAGGLFPTGNRLDILDIPGVGKIEATLINAGNPAIFVDAGALGLRGNELQEEVNTDTALLERCESIRAHAAVAMGLCDSAETATKHRPHTPKLAFVSAPQDYISSSGKPVAKEDIDLTARIFSMGKLHHAMTGSGAVAIAAAASLPGTLVHRLFKEHSARSIRFGHPSGTLAVGAEAEERDGHWVVSKVTMSRSARRLMEGVVFCPEILRTQA